MFAEQLRRAVEASPRVELARVAQLLWKAYAAGQVTEAEASELSDLIESRRALPAAAKPAQQRLGSRPRSPGHLERRRRWAASGCLPPALAARVTLAETAVLAVMAAEHRRRGDCRLTNKEIADVAGVSLTTVKNALRAARALGLISVEERRLSAFRNAPNIVRIVSPEWRAWLRLGGGGKFVPPSPTRYKNQQARPAKPARAAPTPMRGRAPHDQRGADDPALPKPNPPPPTPRSGPPRPAFSSTGKDDHLGLEIAITFNRNAHLQRIVTE